jgi:hypothetical protein
MGKTKLEAAEWPAQVQTAHEGQGFIIRVPFTFDRLKVTIVVEIVTLSTGFPNPGNSHIGPFKSVV